jgi:hypothetical protein
MAAREDQPQSIVGDGHLVLRQVVPRVGGRQVRLDRRLAAEQLGLVAQSSVATESIERPVARRRGDPRRGMVRDPAHGPRIERGDERVLDRLLGEIEVAEDADERRDRPTLLLAE